MILGNKDEKSFDIHINNIEAKKNSNKMSLLGIKINKNLTFVNFAKKYRTNFLVYKLHRMRKHLTAEKEKLLANAIINSQFNFAPLMWLFANKFSIIKILKIKKKNTSDSL